MRILSSPSLEGMERRHWETHCTGSFYDARPTSNLLQEQRLPSPLPPPSPPSPPAQRATSTPTPPTLEKGKKKTASLPAAGPSKKKQKTVERQLTYEKTAEGLEEETARYIKE